jgi:bifunctional aspartokinase / homoserine dehydrogenase 1
MTNIKVNKIGGVVLQNAEGFNSLLKIIDSFDNDANILVVSAFGSTTRHLIDCAETSLKENQHSSNAKLAQILDWHKDYSMQLMPFEKDAIDLIIIACQEDIYGILRGIYLTRELSKKSLDKIMSYGETLALEIVSLFLDSKGKKHSKIDSREFIITDSNFVQAKPIIELCREQVDEKLLPALTNNKLILTQGFVARNQNMETTTMGLESSNLTASLIATLVDAEKIIFWTNVEGIRDIDPNLCSKSKVVHELSYSLAKRAARHGLKVIYPGMLKLAQDGIQIEFRSAFEQLGEWTKLVSSKNVSSRTFLFKKELALVDRKLIEPDTDYELLIKDATHDEVLLKADKISDIQEIQKISLITILWENENIKFHDISEILDQYDDEIDVIRLEKNIAQIAIHQGFGRKLLVQLYEKLT